MAKLMVAAGKNHTDQETASVKLHYSLSRGEGREMQMNTWQRNSADRADHTYSRATSVEAI